MNPTQPQTLYPTRDNLTQVIAEAAQKLPITSFNDVFGLLMVYHNTLLHVLASEPQDKGWRTNPGKHCPEGLTLDSIVEVKLRKGPITRGRVGEFCWKLDDLEASYDILEYRLIE